MGLSDKQVRVHLERLVELEYLLVHHGRNGLRFVYELVFEGTVESDERQLMGLIDAEHLVPVPPKTNGIVHDLVVSKDNLGPARGPLVVRSGPPCAPLKMPLSPAVAWGWRLSPTNRYR